jgi:hypothetical protein
MRDKYIDRLSTSQRERKCAPMNVLETGLVGLGSEAHRLQGEFGRFDINIE